jgi:RNA polymerase sigma factor (sigma-70 family)
MVELCCEENRDMEVEELNRFIEEAILSLPDKCRDVFLKSRNEEMSNREIAEQLNISVKTVEAQITKALKAIRSYITDKMALLWMFF